MLDNILEGLKDQIPGDLLSKVGLGADKADEVVAIAGESTSEVMTEQLTSGGLDTVMNLFSNKKNESNADSLQNNLTNNFVGKLGSKLGLSKEMAGTIATAIIPKILAMITNKNEETDESDSSSITDMFGGGDMLGKAKGMLGGLFN
mgnify:CR=1 FL=1